MSLHDVIEMINKINIIFYLHNIKYKLKFIDFSLYLIYYNLQEIYIKKYILLKNKIVIFKNKFLVFTFMNIKIFYFYYFVLKYILKYQISVSLNKNRNIMEKENIWQEFMLRKADYAKKLLNNYKTVMYIDTDIIFFNNFDIEISDYEIGLFPHFINFYHENTYRKYNARAFITKSTQFCNEWTNISLSYNGFEEQQALDYLGGKFKIKEFDINHNFGWWNIFYTENQNEMFDKCNINN